MLKKLSLAALIAMGSMSVASATPLTEAIKGVDLSGFLRIRYYHEMPKDQNTYNRWRTNGVFIFTVPASENLKFVFRNSVKSNVYTDDNQITDNGTTSVDSGIVNNLMFMKYSNNGFNAIVGKIPVATSITSTDPVTPAHGAGAIATYKVNNNLTVGAAYIDAIVGEVPSEISGNDIYAAVAIFNNDMVSGNAWYYHMTQVAKYIFTASVDVKPVDNVTVHGDYATSKLYDGAAALLGVSTDTKQYFNISATVTQDALSGELGYAYSNNKAGVIVLGADAPLNGVIPTANNTGICNATDTDAIYAKLGYNVDAKTNVYVAYQHENDKTVANNDLDEYTVGGSYAYNKKTSFSAYYDYVDYKPADATDNGEFRFQAIYKF
jgi:hypothetical protein